MGNLVILDGSPSSFEFARLGDASFSLATVSKDGLGTCLLVASHGEKSFAFPVDDKVGQAIIESRELVLSHDSPESLEDKTGVEIERKFALSGVSLESLSEVFEFVSGHKELVQAYIEVGKDKEKGEYELRIRKDGEDFKMTMKAGKGQERIEIEANIPEVLFNSLLAIREADKKHGVVINKTRYMLNIGNRELSLDIYKGENDGLFVVEIEFDSNLDADSFQLPDILRNLGFIDVTSDARFKNKNLAKSPFDKWGQPGN